MNEYENELNTSNGEYLYNEEIMPNFNILLHKMINFGEYLIFDPYMVA